MRKFKNHDRVVIHSWGPNYENVEFYGSIFGLSVDYSPIDPLSPATIWIVLLDAESRKRMNCEFNCVTAPQACLRLDDGNEGWEVCASDEQLATFENRG